MAAAEVDRYIVMPGQACAYKVGHLTILELREKAKRALGPKFDLKDFHAVVLGSGAVPLSVLEELVNDYIHGDGSATETWELNVPKSKPPGPARSAVLTLTVQGDQETSETHIVRMDGVEYQIVRRFVAMKRASSTGLRPSSSETINSVAPVSGSVSIVPP